MKTKGLRMEAVRWKTRSGLECGGPPPFSEGGARPVAIKSAGGLTPSKTWRRLAAFWLLTSACCLPAFAQYAIDWSTIDGGGGTSTGGVYSVSGTIGQPDAGGPMTNGQYSVTGGFWALPTAVQTTNAPHSHHCSGHPRQRHDLVDAEHAGLCLAGDVGSFARQLDQFRERCDQSHRRPGHAADEVLSAVQAVTDRGSVRRGTVAK